MYDQLIEQLDEGLNAMIEDENLIPLMAKLKRKIYLAMVEEGFDEATATQLTIATLNSMKLSGG